MKLTKPQICVLTELSKTQELKYNQRKRILLEKLEALGLITFDVTQRPNALRISRSSLWYFARITMAGRSVVSGTAEICPVCDRVLITWSDHKTGCTAA